MILTYDRSRESQLAAVKVWLGEISAQGSRPVRVLKEELT
jgi:hypothetical protein